MSNRKDMIIVLIAGLTKKALNQIFIWDFFNKIFKCNLLNEIF